MGEKKVRQLVPQGFTVPWPVLVPALASVGLVGTSLAVIAAVPRTKETRVRIRNLCFRVEVASVTMELFDTFVLKQ